jgi:hypothetical protein
MRRANTVLGEIALGEITGFKRQICLTERPFTQIIELGATKICVCGSLDNYLRSDASEPKERVDSGRREYPGIVVGSEA